MGLLSFVAWSIVLGLVSALFIRAKGQRRFTGEHVSNVIINAEEQQAKLASSREAQRQIRQKSALRKRALERRGVTNILRQQGGLPPGQVKAQKWIVLDLGQPSAKAFDFTFGDDWSLDVFAGKSAPLVTLIRQDVENLRGINREWDELRLDFHCVTGWSFENVTLLGVPFSRLLELLRSRVGSDDAFQDFDVMMQVSVDGYTCPVMREDVLASDAFLCVGMRDNISGADIIPLPAEHGTLRLIFPTLYGWKSCKYLRELHFLPEYADGFWEKLGCHRRGRWAEEERWASDSLSASPIWNVLTFINDLWRRIFGQRVWIAMMIFGASVLAKWAAVAGYFQAQKPLQTSARTTKSKD